MESINFDGVVRHKLIHKQLLSDLGEYYSTFKKTGELSLETFQFLAFWLKSHICGIDKKYALLS